MKTSELGLHITYLEAEQVGLFTVYCCVLVRVRDKGKDEI